MTKQIAVALAALAVLIGATVAAERVLAAPDAPKVEFTEDIEVNSGTWYCTPLVRPNETGTLSIGAVGSDPSQVSIERLDAGQSSFEDPVDLDPQAVHEVEIEGEESVSGYVVRWRGGPVVANWRVDGREERLGSRCSSSPAPKWLMTGAETTIGSSARLYLFNPFDNDAVVTVYFATAEGRIDLVSSENVPVPAHDVVDLGINELQPEHSDLGVIVSVQAGRVIASGQQRFGQPDLPDVELEGAEPPVDPDAPQGRTVLPATAVASETVGLAYAASGETTTAWASVVNPNSRPVRVSVEPSDGIEGGGIEDEILIAAESVERIDLSAVSSAPNFGVRLTADEGLPIAANGFVALIGERKRVSAMAAVAETDSMNAQVLVAPPETAEVALFNPGTASATATVAVGGVVPDAWESIDLAPGAMQLLPFADAGVTERGTIQASADQPIYATLRLASEEQRFDQFLTLPLTPANVWQGSANAPPPERDRTLDTRPVDFPAQPDQ
jgi:hypothetical protein